MSRTVKIEIVLNYSEEIPNLDKVKESVFDYLWPIFDIDGVETYTVNVEQED